MDTNKVVETSPETWIAHGTRNSTMYGVAFIEIYRLWTNCVYVCCKIWTGLYVVVILEIYLDLSHDAQVFTQSWQYVFPKCKYIIGSILYYLTATYVSNETRRSAKTLQYKCRYSTLWLLYDIVCYYFKQLYVSCVMYVRNNGSDTCRRFWLIKLIKWNIIFAELH